MDANVRTECFWASDAKQNRLWSAYTIGDDRDVGTRASVAGWRTPNGGAQAGGGGGALVRAFAPG